MSNNQSRRSMGDQLQNIAAFIPKAGIVNFPVLNNIGKDGVHHINISSDVGITTLGQALSFSSSMLFVSEEHGEFDSIDTFGYWLRSADRDPDFQLRDAKTARIQAKDMTTQLVDNFRIQLAIAAVEKIIQYPQMKEELKASGEIALDMYYLQDIEGVKTRVRPVGANWIVPLYLEIRKALIQDRVPEFDFLSDRNQSIGKFSYGNARRAPVLQSVYQRQPTSRELEEGRRVSALEQGDFEKNKSKQLKVVIGAGVMPPRLQKPIKKKPKVKAEVNLVASDQAAFHKTQQAESNISSQTLPKVTNSLENSADQQSLTSDQQLGLCGEIALPVTDSDLALSGNVIDPTSVTGIGVITDNATGQVIVPNPDGSLIEGQLVTEEQPDNQPTYSNDWIHPTSDTVDQTSGLPEEIVQELSVTQQRFGIGVVSVSHVELSSSSGITT